MEAINVDFSTVLLVIGAGIGVVLFGAYLALRGDQDVQDRLRKFIVMPARDPLEARLGDESLFLDRFRSRFNVTFGVLKSEEMQLRLVAANWQITPSEYFFIRLGAILMAFLFGFFILGNPWPGIGLAIIAYIVPGFLLFRSIERRQKQFQMQLVDSLTLIRGAIEAGYSFLQSLNVVIQEIGPPTSDEFRQVRREVELGLPLSRALANMANRMESDDFYMVVTAVTINMQVGGSLSNIMSVVIKTIRDRMSLLGELRSITSYARYASYLLTLLPFITMAIIAMISPDYIQRLFEPGITRIILAYAILSLIIGNLVLRRMASLNI